MPMYYFHLRDGEPVRDVDGTELLNLVEARRHALGVARCPEDEECWIAIGRNGRCLFTMAAGTSYFPFG
jgi:hypothetical protein